MSDFQDRFSDPGFRQFVEANTDPGALREFLESQIEKAEFLWATCGRAQCDGQPHTGMERKHARPEQVPGEGDWLVTMFWTGRRWGKTLSAAQWIRHRALSEVGVYAICAPTYGDVRDVCVEGGLRTPVHRRSGFLSVCAPGEIENYNRSIGEIRMSNGSKIKMLSADEPDRARGWGFNAAWCDELSSWRYPATWYETLLPAVTMSDRHRFVVSSTPKPNKLTKELIQRAAVDPRYRIIRGSSRDNAANLGAGAIDELRSQMTERLARQEIEGELLLDVPGALTTYLLLDICRRDEHPDLLRTIVSVDPAVTDTEESDETGIAVLGRGVDGDCYQIADLSLRTSVTEWARIAVEAAVKYNAGLILYEKNQGADAIGAVLSTALTRAGVPRGDIKLEDVHAQKSKFDRALSLQQWIEDDTFHLVGSFPELEEQLTSWKIDSSSSPDRLDATVHGFRKLMLEEEKPKPRMRFVA